LLALCPHDGGRFLLVQVIWLIQNRRGGLIAGVAALPGMPQATSGQLYRVPSAELAFPR